MGVATFDDARDEMTATLARAMMKTAATADRALAEEFMEIRSRLVAIDAAVRTGRMTHEDGAVELRAVTSSLRQRFSL